MSRIFLKNLEEYDYMNIHEYFTEGQLLKIMADKTNTPIANRYETDKDIISELNRLIESNPETWEQIWTDLEKTAAEFDKDFSYKYF